MRNALLVLHNQAVPQAQLAEGGEGLQPVSKLEANIAHEAIQICVQRKIRPAASRVPPGPSGGPRHWGPPCARTCPSAAGVAWLQLLLLGSAGCTAQHLQML